MARALLPLKPSLARAATSSPVLGLIRKSRGVLLVGLALHLACAGSKTQGESAQSPAAEASESETQAPAETPAEAAALPVDDERGGQLYDKWYVQGLSSAQFVPDDPATKGVADGTGGPNGNGTLNDAQGRAMLNDAGHNYRLKSFFGWDLAGASGIYGADYQNKGYVAPVDLLSAELSDADLETLIRKGSDKTPAYGEVLDESALNDLIGYIKASRTGKLAKPDQIFALSSEAPNFYQLREGADIAAGHTAYEDSCSGCHGDKGMDMLFGGGKFSLGGHSRQKAYEDWFKILNGHPGSPMDRQVDSSVDGASQAQAIANILAALCDRTRYPQAPGGADDVADGDLRCGAYLK